MRRKESALFLLDTNAFSDLMRESPAVRSRLQALRGKAKVVICPIVRGEACHGLERLPPGKRRSQLEAKAAALFGTIECIPLPASAGDHYARTKVQCQRKGLPLDDNDLWIAAAALSAGAVLVCRDSDFDRVEGLPIVNWSV